MDEYAHVAAHGAGAGHRLRGDRARTRSRQRYPFLELDDIQGALWDPLDGDIDPSQLTQAFAKGAQAISARASSASPA